MSVQKSAQAIERGGQPSNLNRRLPTGRDRRHGGMRGRLVMIRPLLD